MNVFLRIGLKDRVIASVHGLAHTGVGRGSAVGF